MASISTMDVKIPRWVRRAERGESKLTPDIDEAFRRTEKVLWGHTAYFILWAVAELVHGWLHAHHEDLGWIGQTLILIPAVSVFFILTGTDQRWVASVVLRARTPGGVGLRWVAQQASLRRWHRVRNWPLPIFLILFIAIWPVTHKLDRHPNATRLEIEFWEQTALFVCYALYTATVHRWMNRKCFKETRAALLAAEAALGQEPVAGATTVG